VGNGAASRQHAKAAYLNFCDSSAPVIVSNTPGLEIRLRQQ
jgi:hypothetical protein